MIWDWIPLIVLAVSMCTRVVVNLDDQPNDLGLDDTQPAPTPEALPVLHGHQRA